MNVLKLGVKEGDTVSHTAEKGQVWDTPLSKCLRLLPCICPCAPLPMTAKILILLSQTKAVVALLVCLSILHPLLGSVSLTNTHPTKPVFCLDTFDDSLLLMGLAQAQNPRPRGDQSPSLQ